MASISTITLGVDRAASKAMVASLNSLNDAAQRSESQTLVDLIQGIVDRASIDVGSLVTFSTDKATVCFEPAEKYLRDVAAIAARHFEFGLICVEFRHGWPILSPGVVADPVVAEGGGVATAAPGGPALCGVCDERLSDVGIRACSIRECPHSVSEAA